MLIKDVIDNWNLSEQNLITLSFFEQICINREIIKQNLRI